LTVLRFVFRIASEVSLLELKFEKITKVKKMFVDNKGERSTES